MAATVQALASTLEVRDPCTAGHQQRVARLAAAIAGRLSAIEFEMAKTHVDAAYAILRPVPWGEAAQAAKLRGLGARVRPA